MRLYVLSCGLAISAALGGPVAAQTEKVVTASEPGRDVSPRPGTSPRPLPPSTRQPATSPSRARRATR